MTYRKILIKSVNWVGDTVLTTPSIRLIRRQYPEAGIVVVARPWVADVLRDNPDIDDLWIVNESKDPAAFFNLLHRIRKERFDLGIAFPNSFISAFILRAGGVGHRIGYDRDGRGWMLSERISITQDILKKHQVEYYLNILQSICSVESAERKLVLPVNEAARKKIQALLREKGIYDEHKRDYPLIGINPGAFYGSAKRWLPERFSEVAEYLQHKHAARIIATGTLKERPIVDEIIELTHGKNIYNAAGAIDLRELIALLASLDLYITNDSGAMHIAAAVGTPIVAIFGSTDWITTAPYSDKAIIVRKDIECAPCLKRHCPRNHECMTAIAVEDVTSPADAQLARYFYEKI